MAWKSVKLTMSETGPGLDRDYQVPITALNESFLWVLVLRHNHRGGSTSVTGRDGPSLQKAHPPPKQFAKITKPSHGTTVSDAVTGWRAEK